MHIIDAAVLLGIDALNKRKHTKYEKNKGEGSFSFESTFYLQLSCLNNSALALHNHLKARNRITYIAKQQLDLQAVFSQVETARNRQVPTKKGSRFLLFSP
jgi:hypothetical protein